MVLQFLDWIFSFAVLPSSPIMKQEEVKRCQIQEWYPKFKSLSIKTIIHELPEFFIDYLLEDYKPFLLPTSISGDDALPRRIQKSYPDDEYQGEFEKDSDDESQEDPEQESLSRSCFPDLESQIKIPSKLLLVLYSPS